MYIEHKEDYYTVAEGLRDQIINNQKHLKQHDALLLVKGQISPDWPGRFTMSHTVLNTREANMN